MPRINEATDTDLKVIERLQQLGWKRGLKRGRKVGGVLKGAEKDGILRK